MSLLQKMFGKRRKQTRPYCAALIAAAGSSTRYGGENKLLQPLDGIPVLVRTLLAIDSAQGIDEIIIAAREDELLHEGSYPRCEATDEMLACIDVLVDGRFMKELKDISLQFRGSRNQRVIDMNRTRETGTVTLWDKLRR